MNVLGYQARKRLLEHGVSIDSAEIEDFEHSILQACPTLGFSEDINTPNRDNDPSGILSIQSFSENDDSLASETSTRHKIKENDNTSDLNHSSDTHLSSSESDTDEANIEEEKSSDESENESHDMVLRNLQKMVSAIKDDFASLSNTLFKCMQLAHIEEKRKKDVKCMQLAHIEEKWKKDVNPLRVTATKEDKDIEPSRTIKVKQSMDDDFEGPLRGKFPFAEDYLITRIVKACRNLHESVQKGLKWVQQRKDWNTLIPISLIEGLKDEETVKREGTDLFDTIITNSVVSSTIKAGLGDRPMQPKLPKASRPGGVINCRICLEQLTNIKSPRDWRNHVYSDIRPYICTFEHCPAGSQRYPDRRSWEYHVEAHLSSYSTINCLLYNCNMSFNSRDDFQRHLDESHFSIPNMSYEKYNALVKLGICKPVVQHRLRRHCPFCGVTLRPGISIAYQHVARHLEFIALHILTSDMEDNEKEFTISTDSESESDEDPTTKPLYGNRRRSSFNGGLSQVQNTPPTIGFFNKDNPFHFPITQPQDSRQLPSFYEPPPFTEDTWDISECLLQTPGLRGASKTDREDTFLNAPHFSPRVQSAFNTRGSWAASQTKKSDPALPHTSPSKVKSSEEQRGAVSSSEVKSSEEQLGPVSSSEVKSSQARRRPGRKSEARKCSYCRIAHKKCLPEDRVWPDRCERCKKSRGNEQCSPPETYEEWQEAEERVRRTGSKV